MSLDSEGHAAGRPGEGGELVPERFPEYFGSSDNSDIQGMWKAGAVWIDRRAGGTGGYLKDFRNISDRR
jgi:hypothetical protein